MNEYVVTTSRGKKSIIPGDDSIVTIDNFSFKYELTSLAHDTYLLKLNNKIFQLTADRLSNDSFTVYVDGLMFELTVRSLIQEKAIEQIEKASAGKHKNSTVKAPMPGMILRIKKQAGDTVKHGESIIILEAMKMENDIHSPSDGIIKNISVSEGNAVEKGAVLFTIE